MSQVTSIDLSYALYPGTFEDIVELLVPELQNRYVSGSCSCILLDAC